MLHENPNVEGNDFICIAQWLERRPFNPGVVRSSPGRGRTYMCLPYGVDSTLWQIKAMPGTSCLFVFVGLHSSEIQEIYFKIVLSGSKEFHSVKMSRSLIYLTLLTVPTDDLDQPSQSLISTMAQMVHFFTSIRILNSEFRILNSEFRILNTEFRILNSEFRISKKSCVWKFCFRRCHIRVRARGGARDLK